MLASVQKHFIGIHAERPSRLYRAWFRLYCLLSRRHHDGTIYVPCLTDSKIGQAADGDPTDAGPRMTDASR